MYGYIVLIFLMSCTITPKYQGPVSDHFNGVQFYNKVPMKKTFWDFLKWQFTSQKEQWPKWIRSNQVIPPIKRVIDDKIYITFINHSSFLIQIKGLNILTDPIFSHAAGPFGKIGPQRVRLPAIKIEDLPSIDIILVGHNHYDHMDIPSLKKISIKQKENPPLVLAGLGNKGLLEKEKILVKELDWHDTIEKKGVLFTFVESQHWSARTLLDRKMTLWGSFIVQTSNSKIYFASDTGYSDHFKRTYNKYGKMDISLLPIGGYEPRWFMKYSHLNPDESLKAHKDLKSQLSFGMHFGTFQLTDEGYERPFRDLNSARIKYNVSANKFQVLNFGETYIGN